MASHLRTITVNGVRVGGEGPEPPKDPRRPSVVSARHLEFQVEPGGLYIRPSSKKGSSEYRAGVLALTRLREVLEKNNIPHKVLEDREHDTGRPLDYYVESVILKPTSK